MFPINKKIIRKRIRERLKEQTERQRRRRSLLIKKKLFSSLEFKSSKVVMFYVSKDDEVETKDMIDEALGMGKIVAVPVIDGRMLKASQIKTQRDLKIGPYGIYQPRREDIKPISTDKIDLAIVPGVAFDLKGNRLGRGKGYYDRFLKGLSSSTKTIGLAFDFQVVEDLPITPSDVPIQKLIVG